MEMKISTNFLTIENDQLDLVNGGGVNLDFIGDAFTKIYNCGKDFGKNVTKAIMSFF